MKRRDFTFGLSAAGLASAGLASAGLASAGLASAGLAALAPRAARAQSATTTPVDWPAQTVRIIVPFPAGGTADILPRIVANLLGPMWNQPVIIDNRPGAAGNIGTAMVAAAKPTGYTLLAAPPPPIAINKHLYRNLSFDPAQLRAVTIMGSAPNVVGTSRKFNVTSLAELIARAKAAPGSVNVANQGLGSTSHLTAAMFETLAGVKFNHVPYSGTAPALNDLMGGQVDILFDNIASSLPQHLAGTIRIVGVCSADRAPQVPAIPTIAESGFPGFSATAWFAIMAPADTPDDIISKVSLDVSRVIKTPEVQKSFINQAAQPIGNTPAEASAFIRSETKLWGEVIEKAGLNLHE